jgi:hypothetical protein
MQAYPGGALNPQHPAQHAPVELPGQYQGGGNPNGPSNTGLYIPLKPKYNPTANISSRHELAEQTNPQIAQQISHYTPLSFLPFSIPTGSDSLSSGFPYNQRLSQLRVTHDQWHQFSLEVVNAAKLSFSEDAAAWATGVGTGAASSAFLLVFGPVVGYYTGKSVHKKTVVKKVKEKLAQDGELRNVLRRWNEGAFRERGVQVWMEAPTEEVVLNVQPGMSQADIQKEAQKLAKRFRIVVLPYDPRNAPVGQNMSPVSPLNSQYGLWGSGQSPVQTAPAQGWGPNQAPMKPYMAPMQQGQEYWGNQQQLRHDGKPVAMVQELPDAPAGPFIAELDAGTGTTQSPPGIPPKIPPKVSEEYGT